MSNMNLFKHGGNKKVIDELNDNLITILQEDGLICHGNKAEVLVRPEDMEAYSGETLEHNTIKIVLRSENDLTIAQTQIKGWGDSRSRNETLSCFNTNKTRHPFENEPSRIELLSFNTPSCF